MSTRAYADVAEILLRRLREAYYRPGTRLPAERQLAEELGVSRPTLREALAALELMGVVYTHVGAGTFVSDTDPASADGSLRSEDASPSQILAARLVIEPEVAALASDHWDRQSLAVIARPLKQLERAAATGSATHPTNEDRQFHAAISRAAGNEVLVSLLNPLWEMMTQSLWRRLKSRGWGTEHTRRVAVEHREIYEAIRARDAALARFTMEKHVRGVITELFADRP